jgi:hypothetical protein
MFDELGGIGVWRSAVQLSPELAVTLKQLGHGAIRIGGSPGGDLRFAEHPRQAGRGEAEVFAG